MSARPSGAGHGAGSPESRLQALFHRIVSLSHPTGYNYYSYTYPLIQSF